MTRTLAPILAVLVGTAACSSGDSGDDAGCVAAACAQQCHEAGYTTGVCAGSICQCSGSTDADADGDGDDDDAGADADGEEGETTEEDAGPEDVVEWEVDPCAPASCGPVEECGETTQGDGVDNDCDTEVDEGCVCGGVGTTLECMAGDPAICPAGAPCRGSCTRGVETCTEFAIWGGCLGAVTPVEERCDSVDNDCDGLYDEDMPGCDSPVICPDTVTAAPMTYVPLDGGSIFPGTFESWLWTVSCPTTVVTCPTPEEPTMRDTQVLLISSGTYHARATIGVGAGVFYTCEYAIVLQGQGLRVELTWDTQGTAHGDTDVDLHLHQWGDESPFFASPQDCYYGNCKASSCCGWTPPFTRPVVNWDRADTTDLAACQDAPHGEGARWVTLGYCANPRLDVDVVFCNSGVTDPTGSFCAPENINVDNPPLYEPMRIMVNYYGAHSYSGVTNSSINVYCGGGLRATFGPQPLRVSGSSSGDNWMVADVMFYVGECGALDCEIVPLGTPPAGVIINGPAFGPTWSTFVHTP